MGVPYSETNADLRLLPIATIYQARSAYNNQLNNGGTTNTEVVESGNPYGVSTLDTDWRKYSSWISEINTSASRYTHSNNGPTVLKAGYYKVTVNLQMRSTVDRTAVAFRFAINDTMIGPVGCAGPTSAAGSTNIFGMQGTITHIFSCEDNDTISVYTSRMGATGNVQTRDRSSLHVEWLGAI